MRTRIKTCLICGMLLATAFTACRRQAEFEVTGQVTLDGEPLAEATISFVPDDESLIGAIARTDAQGNYDAEISTDQNGLAPGTYTVRITTYDEGESEADPPIPPDKERVPSKYNYDSELKVVVQPAVNRFDFQLDSKGRIESPKKQAKRPEGGATGGALADGDLQYLIANWQRLSTPTRAGIMRLAQSEREKSPNAEVPS